MNKIFKLLAVLMLFSALSAGSMTVQAETTDGYVAQIENGDKYTSLDAAITAANAGDTIKLLGTIDLGTGDIVPGKTITIDLTGYSLKAVAFSASGAKVVDNSATKTGRLEVDSQNCTFSKDNPQVPVYDTQKGGYAFATMKEQVHRVSEMSEDPFKLIFKPDFGALNQLLANNENDAEVSIEIKLEWTGASDPVTLVYKNEMVQTVYSDSGKAFYIELTNFSNVDDLTITPMVMSELGTEWSKTEFEAGKIYYEQDFADETAGYLFTYGGNPKGVYKHSGNAAPEKVSGDNKLRVTSSGESYRVEVRWSDKTNWSDAESCRDLQGKTVVYEFELTPNGDVDGTPGIGKLYVILRSQNAGTSTFCTVENNALKFNGVDGETILKNGSSYKIKVVYKYGQGIRDIYVNEECVAIDNPIPGASFQLSGVNDLIRFYQTATVDFNIDDIRVYESQAD